MGKYAFDDNVPVSNGRSGPKLDKFGLGDMKVGQSFLIPFTTRSIRGEDKQVPESGFNVKAANEAFKPKRFVKKRTDGGIRVHRVE